MNFRTEFTHVTCLAMLITAWAMDSRAQETAATSQRFVSGRLVSGRLVSERPEANKEDSVNPFVETQRGYMVPYQGRIPGTDITFAMVPVPGSDINGQRANWIEPFWIGKYEVTLAEYREFMRTYDTFRHLESDRERLITPENEINAVSAPTTVYDPNWRFEFAEDDVFESGKKAPATSMSQFAARQYTKWLSLIGDVQYRLPSEVEWEHACRAGRKTKWSFGDDPSIAPQFAHFEHPDTADEFYDRPMPVGSLKPNRWGIHDMHGNVSEWVVLRKHLRDGIALFNKQPDRWNAATWTQQREAAFKQWILKGGDWTKSVEHCRTAIRQSATEELWIEDPSLPHSPTWMASDDATRIGFRIISPLNAMPRTEIEKYWGPDSKYLADSENMNVEGGRGVRGLVDQKLPEIVRKYSK